MNHDIAVLRLLANQYVQTFQKADDTKIWKLHAGVNDLCPQRPIVLINELPWHELNVDGSLTLQCQDSQFKQVEEYLRKILFQYKYFPGDMRVLSYVPVVKTVHSTGIGVEVKEETLAVKGGGEIVSHRYKNQFHSIEDIEKLHSPVISYDEDTTMYRYGRLSEAIGDILPVKIVGESTGYELGHTAWDIISTYMNADNLLFALVDEPELMHAFAEKLTTIFQDTIRQYEEQNLLNADSAYCHCSSAASNELRQQSVDYQHVKAENVWGRGLAQILAAVSPAMHEEFEIEYAKRAMKPFGLVYYGCCEPLDKKIDIVKKIPHLRKISITPWADINRAAEAVGSDYVISAKPNPANLPYAASNPDLIRKEIRNLLTGCRKNNTPCEILLKDISTVGSNLENLIVWNRIAEEEVRNSSLY